MIGRRSGAAHAGCMFVFGGESERTLLLSLTPNTYGYDFCANRVTLLPNFRSAFQGLKGRG
jgi:hypothetical protein